MMITILAQWGCLSEFRDFSLRTFAFVAVAVLVSVRAHAATLLVGPGASYSTPCQAIAAASPGDKIEIDGAGAYAGDVCAIYQSNLTLQGVNGRPRIDAAGQSASGKAIWVIVGNNTIVDNIEFTGERVDDRNGAGIRQEGQNLTVRRCYFHDNDEGILTGDNLNSEVVIEFTEFGFNGFGDGYSHNVYIGHVGSFSMRFSYSHDAIVGHLLKSRAAANYILYNRLSSENGTTSYELDLPNGGRSYVIGNIIQQGANAQNPIILAYAEEGADPANPAAELYVVNNTFVNDFTSGAFIYVEPSIGTLAVILNNIFDGPGAPINVDAVFAGNFSGDPLFVDRSSYDYHLKSSSPAINAGIDPGLGSGISLMPNYQYLHPSCGETRIQAVLVDIGAYKYGGSGEALACNSPPPQ